MTQNITTACTSARAVAEARERAIDRIREAMRPAAAAIAASRNPKGEYRLDETLEVAVGAAQPVSLTWHTYGIGRRSDAYDTYNSDVWVHHADDATPEALAEVYRLAVIRSAEIMRTYTAQLAATVATDASLVAAFDAVADIGADDEGGAEA